jgi:membrane-bound lytic murein transglycosylase D
MSKRISILIFSFLIGCVNLESKNLVLADNNDLAATSPNVVEVAIDREPFDLWERIRDDLTFAIPKSYGDIDRYRKRFVNNQYTVNRLSKSGQRYLFHTVKRAEELGVPVELALLPFVESEFDPYAQSLYGAAGIWQFLPATGREWGLKTNWWYDGKRDVIASTEAALNFLIYLHQKFDNDWLLAIAAYNAGPGRVNRAIRENKRKGMATDFWSLRLPKETSAYVPKLLVLCELIKDPSGFGVTLPSIANRPYFTKIETPGQVDLMQAADLAGMTPEAIYELNPGFSQWATDPSGPHYLLLPTGVADRFLIQLLSLEEVELVQWDRYKIKRGDTLTRIAKQYSIEVPVLMEINQMDSDIIYANQEIMVPRGPAWVKTFVPKARTYEVVKGDTFWGISKKFGVTIQDISLWNDLGLTTPLQIGQEIKIFSKYERVRGKTPNKKTRTLLYPVKSGDTLSRIGARFGIGVKELQEWNELKSPERIYPGQVIKIILEAGVDT